MIIFSFVALFKLWHNCRLLFCGSFIKNKDKIVSLFWSFKVEKKNILQLSDTLYDFLIVGKT